jgi:hypothetical protein
MMSRIVICQNIKMCYFPHHRTFLHCEQEEVQGHRIGTTAQ